MLGSEVGSEKDRHFRLGQALLILSLTEDRRCSRIAGLPVPGSDQSSTIRSHDRGSVSRSRFCEIEPLRHERISNVGQFAAHRKTAGVACCPGRFRSGYVFSLCQEKRPIMAKLLGDRDGPARS